MKSSLFMSALSAVVFFILSAASHSHAQNSPVPDCGDKLNNQTFCCQWKDSAGNSSTSETFTFSGTENPSFTLTTSTGPDTYICTCQVNGSVNTPKFDISKNFICASTSGTATALVGTATGNKITKGQWNYGGFDSIYTCTAGPCD